MKKKILMMVAGMLLCSNLFGCGTGLSEPDDYVTNEGYKSVQECGEVLQGDPSKAIPVEEINCSQPIYCNCKYSFSPS